MYRSTVQAVYQDDVHHLRRIIKRRAREVSRRIPLEKDEKKSREMVSCLLGLLKQSLRLK
ncbi:hypothetical protein ACMHYO_11840 [Allopusillimonas ginsengisoli]|uniref:hypothetical protein n=1 Tax=Allopusillimonas ginsengisoli TaxID=453575 RepID=UPI0039C3AB78